ncbi:MAG: nitrilase-related carbon-nitrogen hydrolase [Terriglobales bacterium]
MRLALVQFAPALLHVEGNLTAAVERMHATPADVYLLPELATSGYTFAAQDEVDRCAEPADDGPSLHAFAAFAREHNAYVVYGFPERAGGKFFNSASLLAPSGRLATYRKLHVFGREKLFFAAGDAPAPVVELPWGKVGVMICFDWYFPELARSLALRGAELLLHPANLVLPHCPQAMITRSLENHVFSATCDRVGTESNRGVQHEFIGSSQVVSPAGELLVRLSREREETAVVETDLAQARSKAVGEFNDLFADRRAVHYV